MVTKHQQQNRQRRGTPRTEEEDQRLIAIAQLPPRAIADTMRRSWLACRHRLIYLRASGVGSDDAPPRRSSGTG